MNKVRLQVIAPKRVIFDGECTMIEYNTTEGYVGVLPGHIAMTQIIAPGRLTIYEENKEKPLYLTAMSGIATIMPDTITLLTEISEFKEEIDVERAKAARERALKRLEEKLEGTDMVRASKALRRAETRLEVAGLK
jgi:F-type H+-transporting ATPase subunit epsilon